MSQLNMHAQLNGLDGKLMKQLSICLIASADEVVSDQQIQGEEHHHHHQHSHSNCLSLWNAK
jgi:hypothetical protein